MTSKPYKPQIDYPIEDWADDLGDLFSLGAMAQNLGQLTADFFRKKYPGKDVQARAVRITAALQLLRDYPVELKVAADGDGLACLPIAMTTALYRVYISIPDELITQQVDWRFVVALAKEQRDWNEDRG